MIVLGPCYVLGICSVFDCICDVFWFPIVVAHPLRFVLGLSYLLRIVCGLLRICFGLYGIS